MLNMASVFDVLRDIFFPVQPEDRLVVLARNLEAQQQRARRVAEQGRVGDPGRR